MTGFEPFGGDSANPSWMSAQALHGRLVLGHRVVGACLPTAFGTSAEALRDLLQHYRPDLVLCTGQAGGRTALSLERIAINVDDARIADNTGARPIDVPVVAGAPAAYFSTLPIKAMLVAALDAGVRAEVSQTAGTFVCNHIFYALMHELALRPPLAHTRGGFVHVPWLPGQGQPSMPLDEMVLGLQVAIEAALANVSDIRRGAGALD